MKVKSTKSVWAHLFTAICPFCMKQNDIILTSDGQNLRHSWDQICDHFESLNTDNTLSFDPRFPPEQKRLT